MRSDGMKFLGRKAGQIVLPLAPLERQGISLKARTDIFADLYPGGLSISA